MAIWSKIKSAAKTSYRVGQKTYHAGKNIKGTASNISDIAHNGINNVAKSWLTKKGRQQLMKLAKRVGKAILKFLATPPWGWVVSALLIFGMSFAIHGINKTGSTGINGGSGSNKTTTAQYTALSNGCSTGNGAESGISGSSSNSAGTSTWTLAQVKSFANESYTSTWGVSNDDAAQYFLDHNTAVATKYGLNKDNIGKVINAVKAEGVSPVFFFLYSVNEVGGAGGYINHFQSSDMTGDAVKDAKKDADYIVSESNNMSNTPATGSGEPSDMPTAEAASVLAATPAGSLGRVYIKATSATTAELETLMGKTGDWSGKYGNSFQYMMTNITKLNGDVTKGEKAKASSTTTGGDMTDTSTDSSDCSSTTSSSSSLKSGGLTLSEALSWITDNYYNVSITTADIPGAEAGTPDIHDNCTAFTSFFIKHYTSLSSSAGNGGEKVANLVSANQGKIVASSTPTVYSVFSIKGGSAGTSGSAGHTGIVLGIDTTRNVAILGQAGYGMAYNASWVAEEKPLSDMTAAKGWSFTDVSKYVNGLDK